MADIPVSAKDIAGMGVGGLLTEIASRPQPRERPARAATTPVHAAVLAAGRSSRMEGPNKLVSLFDGVPLVRRSVMRVVQSTASGVTLVCGHQREKITAAVSGLEIRIRNNPDFASGLASSLQAAVLDVPKKAGGLLIVLADMPGITTADIDLLISKFRESGGESIVRATHNGKRGNPVVLPRAMFADVLRLEGDTGARHLVERSSLPVIDVEIGASASLDVDTRDAVVGAGGVLPDE
jgi:molybdenum cofactor cytidylyltransferase